MLSLFPKITKPVFVGTHSSGGGTIFNEDRYEDKPINS